MAEECTHDCSTCAQNCADREPESLLEPLNPNSEVRKVIGVLSGKGGVGKSLVTSLLAVNARRGGLKAGIMDADVTGPSIPQAFGIHGRADGDDSGIYPLVSKTGIPVMSVNLLLADPTDPVVWRGPVIAGVVKQFWTDVVWGDLDVMFIDMPPGTGDVPLTVMQSIPLDGLVIVSTPQELVGGIVQKAVKMAGLLQIPILALVENMSYVPCPDCGKKIEVFGPSRARENADRFGIPLALRLPMDPMLSAACDAGTVELYEGNWLDPLSEVIQAGL